MKFFLKTDNFLKMTMKSPVLIEEHEERNPQGKFGKFKLYTCMFSCVLEVPDFFFSEEKDESGQSEIQNYIHCYHSFCPREYFGINASPGHFFVIGECGTTDYSEEFKALKDKDYPESTLAYMVAMKYGFKSVFREKAEDKMKPFQDALKTAIKAWKTGATFGETVLTKQQLIDRSRQEAKELSLTWRTAKANGQDTTILDQKCLELEKRFERVRVPDQLDDSYLSPSWHDCVSWHIDPRYLVSKHGKEILDKNDCPIDAILTNDFLSWVNSNPDRQLIVQMSQRFEQRCPRGWYDLAVRTMLTDPKLNRVIFDVDPKTILPDTLWSAEYQARVFGPRLPA